MFVSYKIQKSSVLQSANLHLNLANLLVNGINVLDFEVPQAFLVQ